MGRCVREIRVGRGFDFVDAQVGLELRIGLLLHELACFSASYNSTTTSTIADSLHNLIPEPISGVEPPATTATTAWADVCACGRNRRQVGRGETSARSAEQCTSSHDEQASKQANTKRTIIGVRVLACAYVCAT